MVLMEIRLLKRHLRWVSRQSRQLAQIAISWCFHSTMFSMDPIEAAEDVVNRPRITHALFIHADSFTGSITPIRSILTNVRKVRKDVTICVDNRLSYSLHPLSSTSSIIDYSVSLFVPFHGRFMTRRFSIHLHRLVFVFVTSPRLWRRQI